MEHGGEYLLCASSAWQTLLPFLGEISWISSSDNNDLNHRDSFLSYAFILFHPKTRVFSIQKMKSMDRHNSCPVGLCVRYRLTVRSKTLADMRLCFRTNDLFAVNESYRVVSLLSASLQPFRALVHSRPFRPV